MEARAFEGAGAIGLLVVGGPATEAQAAGVPAEGPAPVETSDAPSPPADPVAALTTLTAALEARGYGTPTLITADGYIGPGEVRTQTVVLGPGCTVVVGAAARAETDLDLYLADESGAPLDRDTGVQPTARVRACPSEAIEARVSVKAYGRRGSYALSALRAPATIMDVSSLRLEEATASFIGRGYVEGQRTVRAMEESGNTREPIYVRPGGCVAVAAAGDADIEDVDVFLRTAEGRLVASSSGPEPFATVTRCADPSSSTGEQLRLEVLVYHGHGDVTVARFEGTP